MLQPISQDKLDEMHLEFSTRPGVPCRQIAMQLARFSEAVAIGEGNRQLEALAPKKPAIVLPVDITPQDHARMTLELRSHLFTYFLWHLPADSKGYATVDLMDRAVAAIDQILADYQGQEKP